MDRQITDDGYEAFSRIPVMSRGLSQVLFNYLPERTFDYDRGACIGKVFELRIDEVSGIDTHRLLETIRRYVSAWVERVEDLNLRHGHLVLFGRPRQVLFNLFPLAFQCGYCDRVKTFQKENEFVKAGGVGSCSHCGKRDRFEQLYHILVHECGAIAPIRPPECRMCHTSAAVVLDLRGSQSARDFRWLCRRCGKGAGAVQRPCSDCASRRRTEAAGGGHMMRLIPHRANQAFYAHHVTVLNLPTEEVATLRDHPLRDQILARAVVTEQYDLAKLLRLTASDPEEGANADDGELEKLLSFASPEEREQLREKFARLQQLKRIRDDREASELERAADAMPEGGWLEALEYLNVHTRERRTWNDLQREIDAKEPGSGILAERFRRDAASIGIGDFQLIQDFPVVTAVFGYTRVSFEPESRLYDQPVLTTLRGFATPQTGPSSHRNRRPIFVDDSATEGLLVKLSPQRVLRWLHKRGHEIEDISDSSPEHARRWLLRRVVGVDRFVTLADVPVPTRDVFTLVHSYAHMMIRALGRISGIDRTSLAEYLFPRTASFVVYNTKASVNLGGLNTVFAELQGSLISALRDDVLLRTCVYDPVCWDEWHGSCHACMHLAEMSCKHYNRGLSRTVLFGGTDGGPDAGFLTLS